MPEQSSPPITLAAEWITKTYAAVPVLSEVDLELRAGEVHAILGENGAGKSTLIKILSGTVVPDSGTLTFRGKEVRLSTPHDALRLGISVVHQEFNYCPTLSVTENLFLGRSLPCNRFGAVDWRRARQSARNVLDELSVRVDVRRPVASLSPEVRKLVEISRALLHESSVLILDEPTAALPADESEQLFDVIGRLRDRGVAIGYVSHRLEEVLRLSNRISVLRDGHLVASRMTEQATLDDLVRLMVGRSLSNQYPERTSPLTEDPVFEVIGLRSPGSFDDVTFQARRGEVLGIAGLDGSGRSELLQAIAGDRFCSAGEIRSGGDRIGPGSSIYATIRSGIAYVPPDRQHEGLHLNMSVTHNIALPSLRAMGRGPLLDRQRERHTAVEFAERLHIRPPRVGNTCATFSGGNQQKVLLAKWLATAPTVLLLDEPTRGVDVGAKAEIHALVRSLAERGTVVVMASTDMPELLGMTDRILVLRAGRVSGVFDTARATAEVIGRAASAPADIVENEAVTV